jgi:hypothetical protein
MRKLVNDIESQMLTHRLSSGSQYSADSVSSCGNVASRLPISTHSFEQQLTKETVTSEEIVAKSEAATVRSLNSMIVDDLFSVVVDGILYTSS